MLFYSLLLTPEFNFPRPNIFDIFLLKESYVWNLSRGSKEFLKHLAMDSLEARFTFSKIPLSFAKTNLLLIHAFNEWFTGSKILHSLT